MAGTKEYATSIETRGRIMEVCTQLFYEKGYTKTTYAEICRLANVHPGAITYHFGNKKSLAGMLYQQIIEDYNAASERLFPEEDELEHKLIANGLHHRLFFEDENFRRFVAGFSSDVVQGGDLTEYIDTSSKAYHLTCRYIGETRAKFLFTAFKGMDVYLDRYICENIDELAYEQVFIYISEVYHPYLERTELYARLERAMHLIELVDVRFENFRAIVTKKEA